MTANVITLARVALVFLAVLLFETGFCGQLAGFVLTLVVIYMDSLDGYLARRLGIASDLGALLDITGDRIVENVYWIYFAAVGMISFWIPALVITRGFLTDSLRSLAFADGRTPFGERTMMRSGVTRLLVSSRLSRGVYGASKAVIFCYLAGLIALRGAMESFPLAFVAGWLPALDAAGRLLAYAVLAMCLIRGIPVLWDGRVYLLEKRYPRSVRKEP